jgi:hypothetical protein
MTIIHASPPVADLVNPEPTAAKRLRAWLQDPLKGAKREAHGLDVARLVKHHTTHGAKVVRRGDFGVPIGIRGEPYERLRTEKVKAFLASELASNWEWTGDRITVEEGVYPYHDLDNVPDFGRRQYIVRSTFRYTGKVIRMEIDPAMTRPIRLGDKPFRE